MDGDRFFINITESGCGTDCKYCYINGPNHIQNFIENDLLLYSLEFISSFQGFKKGRKGTLISLCPDTDPFKSKKSIEYIAQILKKFIPYGNPIQISTKEIIPFNILSLISKNQVYKGQVVIFISNNTISRASEIEPHAPSIDVRFENFKILKKLNIKSCLYIKPVSNLTLNDSDLYISKILEFDLDFICLGIYYRAEHNEIGKRFEYKHPAHAFDLVSNEKSIDNIKKLRKLLIKKIKNPVFHSSVCVSAFARNYYPYPRIWESFPDLCTNCRDCEYQYFQEKIKNIN